MRAIEAGEDSTAADDDEYKYLGMFMGQFLWVLRSSMGDNANTEVSKSLDSVEVWIFWGIWILTVVVTSVIFLNFIIAEASASYAKVVNSLEAIIQKERASMIYESETMSFKFRKTPGQYPAYIVVRMIET